MNAYTIENTEMTFDFEMNESIDWIGMEDEEFDAQIDRFSEMDAQLFMED